MCCSPLLTIPHLYHRCHKREAGLVAVRRALFEIAFYLRHLIGDMGEA